MLTEPIAALTEYEQERNRETKGIYEFTCDFARMEPPSPQMRPIFEALSRNREQANRFMGVPFADGVLTKTDLTLSQREAVLIQELD